ncbi:hypothetical protein EJB05_45516, partial [Eragrostis curvula]
MEQKRISFFLQEQETVVLRSAKNLFQCSVVHLHQLKIHHEPHLRPLTIHYQPQMIIPAPILQQKTLLQTMIILAFLKKKMTSTSYLLRE